MGLQEDINEIKNLLQTKEEEPKKKFKLPKKVSTGKVKKNWITALIINENHGVNFKKIQIEDQTIVHETIPRLASAGYILYYKKYPFIILPSWSVQPFSPIENYEKSLKDGSNIAGYKLLLSKMLMSQTDTKKKVGKIIPWVIGIGLLLIIGYAFLSGGI